MKPLQDHPAVYPKNSRISISEQRVHKLLTAEHLQIFHAFTQPYVLNRYLKVIGYTYDHTTLAVPSSFVMANSFTSVAAVNCLACSKAFCPVEPSNTNKIS